MIKYNAALNKFRNGKALVLGNKTTLDTVDKHHGVAARKDCCAEINKKINK